MSENKKILIPYIAIGFVLSLKLLELFQGSQKSLQEYGITLFFIVFGGQIIFSYHYGKTIYTGYTVLGPEKEQHLRLMAALAGYGILLSTVLFL